MDRLFHSSDAALEELGLQSVFCCFLGHHWRCKDKMRPFTADPWFSLMTLHNWPLGPPWWPSQLTHGSPSWPFTVDPWFALNTLHSWPLVQPDIPSQLTLGSPWWPSQLTLGSPWWPSQLTLGLPWSPFTIDPWFTLMTITIDHRFALITLHSWPLVHPDDHHSWPLVHPDDLHSWPLVHPDDLHNWPLVHPDDLRNWLCLILMTIHNWPVTGYQESVYQLSSSPAGKLDWGSSLQQPPWFGRFPHCVTLFYSWLCFRHEHNPYGERIWGRAGGTITCSNRRYENGMCATSLDSMYRTR